MMRLGSVILKVESAQVCRGGVYERARACARASVCVPSMLVLCVVLCVVEC